MSIIDCRHIVRINHTHLLNIAEKSNMKKVDLDELVTKGDLSSLRKDILVDFKGLIQSILNPPKAFYSIPEFSNLTGIPKGTVNYKCKVGLLKARQDAPNSTWLIDASEIERYRKESEDFFSGK